MSVKKPYYLTVRQFKNRSYAAGGSSRYINHPLYAKEPSNYIRAFQLILKDLMTLFEYIKPGASNKKAYSLRTFELFLRTCTEIEANFKSILRANTYTPSHELNIKDYFKINSSHFLSKYEVQLPHWEGAGAIRKPFKAWGSSGPNELKWHQAYNHVKHDRAKNLKFASLENLVDAVCGLAIVIGSQFFTYDFTSPDYLIASDGEIYELIGDYFRVTFPQRTLSKDCYDFDWQTITATPGNPFQKFDYNKV